MEKLYLTANIFNDIAAIILFGSGIYFTVRFDFFQFKGLGRIFSKTIGSLLSKNSDKNSFKLFCSSLAGAAGVGNITGVSTAILMGGPGAVFWMWVAAFLGMATKYAETLLAVKNNVKKYGFNCAPMTYISKASKGNIMSLLFAILGVLVSLMMGNVVQSRAVCDAIYQSISITDRISGPVICLIITIIIFGGIKRIGQITERTVPIMTLLYGILCTAVIISNIENLLQAFQNIFIYAFKPMAATGGFIGSAVSNSIRCGVSKGIFSNEAGLGSAGLAYGGTNDVKPDDQAIWGAFDVFADTVIISTFTALAVLTSSGWNESKSIVVIFNETMGKPGSIIGAICITLFAIASIIVWEYYGETCFAYITNGRFTVIFRIIFCSFILIGSTTQAEILWPLSEIANTMMMGINMFGVLKNEILNKKKNSVKK